MPTNSIFSLAYRQVRRPTKFIFLLFVGIIFSALYPSDIDSYPILPAGAATPANVSFTEHYLRFVPTVVQISLPLLLRDKVGLIQLLYAGVTTTVVTHGMKRFLNDRWIFGTRLGQRPSRTGSKQNMPSGHSSMASCAVYFVGKRYNIWLGALLTAILLLTMYARVMLNDHTISAVVAGAMVGFLTTAMCTSRRMRRTAVVDEWFCSGLAKQLKI